MRKTRKGFTLIEMVIVVLIIGILASIGLPYYYKTIESTKAGDAVAIGHLLASANRMYQVDHPGPSGILSGMLSNTACDLAACVVGNTSVCQLIACNYVARQDWDSGAYQYTVGPGLAASARRVTTGPRAAVGDYASWGYDFDLAGRCTPVWSGATPAPSCPSF